jgi:hypothetical protein
VLVLTVLRIHQFKRQFDFRRLTQHTNIFIFVVDVCALLTLYLVHTARMTNNNPLNNGLNNNQFHLCQIVALSLTYRRILKACLGLPSLTILSPLAFQFVCFLSDHLTMNHSLLSILLTYFGTSYIREMIGKSAPSKKQADESLAKTNLSLPCFIFAATLILIRFVVTPIEKSLGLANILTWTPKVATGFAFRLAIGMLILGFAVILRFVGPASIGKLHSGVSAFYISNFLCVFSSPLLFFSPIGAFSYHLGEFSDVSCSLSWSSCRIHCNS